MNNIITRTVRLSMVLLLIPISAAHALVNINKKTFEYQGLTPAGLQSIKSARDVLRERVRLFNNEFKNLNTVHHAVTVSRLCQNNMFMYGPPGGAKSAVVKWLFGCENEPAFQLQLHQMMTEQAFVGGQNLEKAKLGEFEINSKGSLAGFQTALIDEIEKGNPAALSALLSLLNEREILAGNKVIKARLETLFATSNANLAEIFEQFRQGGQGSTAPALLNRFQSKAFIYNWLSKDDQAVLDARKEQKRKLSALAKYAPDIMKNEVFLAPKQLDWEKMRELANIIIKPSDLFHPFLRDFVGDMRSATNKAIRESEERNRNSHIDEPFVYFPSCDYTERVRGQLTQVVIMSAFADFLLSPWADDANIEKVLKKQIEIGSLSLWRTYLMMTTIGPGTVQVKAGVDGKIDLNFDFPIDEATARDNREALLIKNLKEEQGRFKRILMEHINKLQIDISVGAQFSPVFNANDDSDAFEKMLIKNAR